MRKLSWLPKSGEIIINSKCLRLQREVVGGKEAEKRNKSFPSSSHRRLAFPILNTTHLSRRFDKFMYKHGNKTENNHSKIQFHKEQVNQVLQKSGKKNTTTTTTTTSQWLISMFYSGSLVRNIRKVLPHTHERTQIA